MNQSIAMCSSKGKHFRAKKQLTLAKKSYVTHRLTKELGNIFAFFFGFVKTLAFNENTFSGIWIGKHVSVPKIGSIFQDDNKNCDEY